MPQQGLPPFFVPYDRGEIMDAWALIHLKRAIRGEDAH